MFGSGSCPAIVDWGSRPAHCVWGGPGSARGGTGLARVPAEGFCSSSWGGHLVLGSKMNEGRGRGSDGRSSSPAPPPP
eukprot:scaffold7709_cov101-Isochrysis_galbana.AAC.1